MPLGEGPSRLRRESLPLAVIHPKEERRHIRVDRSPFRIGRLPDNELTLRDSRISRNHAQILLEDGRFYIEDSGSRHGVFVNGEKVSRAVLRPHDRIDFGIEDSYVLEVDEETLHAAPLFRKVAEMPSTEGAGKLGRLSAVIEVARALESAGSVDDVLRATVDEALAVTGAERGFLMLKGPAGQLEVRIARDDKGRSLPDEDLRIPRGVISEALNRRRDLFSMSFDAQAHGAAQDPGQTIQELDLRSVLCVPIVRIRLDQQGETSMLSAARDTLGALYMDSREAGADLAAGNRELLQSLAINISSVLENARLLDEERRKHYLEQELQIAREIQQALLPASLPSDGWLVAAGSSAACFQVGGDYYDVIQLGEDSWGAVLADVSGKGVSAALLTSLLQGAFSSAVSSDANLSDVVGRINQYIAGRSRHARFATAFCCVIDRSGRFRWVNAGHCNGLILRAGGEVERLEPTSHPIGLFAGAHFPERTSELQPGDKLLLYSDGLSEAMNRAQELFGDERLEEIAAARRTLSPEELQEALLEEVAAFAGGVEQSDDLTLLVLGYQG